MPATMCGTMDAICGAYIDLCVLPPKFSCHCNCNQASDTVGLPIWPSNEIIVNHFLSMKTIYHLQYIITSLQQISAEVANSLKRKVIFLEILFVCLFVTSCKYAKNYYWYRCSLMEENCYLCAAHQHVRYENPWTR